MAKAIEGAAIIGLGVAATLASAGTLGPVAEGLAGMAISALGTSAAGFSALAASMVASGVAMEAGTIAGALTSNRGMNVTTRQPAANRQIIYGQQRVGGIMIFKSTTGSHHDQMNYVIVLAGHTCSALVNLYLDGRQVHWAGGGGNVTRGGFNFGGAADGNSYPGPNGVQYNFGGAVYCEARFGDQVDGDVIAALTANDPHWAAGPTGSPWVGGCTYVYLKLEDNASLFPGEPEIRITVNGKDNIWDPRTQTSGYTCNGALVLADVITDSAFGLNDNTVNQAQLIAAANICDEQVAVGAVGVGVEARYTINNHYDTSQGPGDALLNMLPAIGGGRLTQAGGEHYIFPGSYPGVSAVFDKNIFTAPIQWNPVRSTRDLINRVDGTYTAPTFPYNVAGNLYDRNGYYNGQIQNNFAFAFQTTNAPQYAADTLHGFPSDQWLTADGGNQHPLNLDLPAVLSVSQWQRIAKIYLLRNRQQGSGTFEMGLKAYGLQPNDVFQLTFPEMGWTNKLFQVTGTTFKVVEDQSNGTQSIRYTVNVIDVDPSIYNWSAIEELKPDDSPASPSQTPLTPAPPTNMTLNSGPAFAQINPDGTVNNIIAVGWDTPLDNLAIGIQIQYRVSGTSTWIAAPNGFIEMNVQWISNVIPGQFYDVQIRSYRANGTASDWAEQDHYQVIDTPTDLGQLAAQLPALNSAATVAAGEMLLNSNFAKPLNSDGTIPFWIIESGSPEIVTNQIKVSPQSLECLSSSLAQSLTLMAGHTYLLQSWVMTDGSVIGGTSLGAGLLFTDTGSHLTIQKINGTVVNAGNTFPGVVLAASSASPWTLLQITVSCAVTGSYTVGLTDSYGSATSVSGAHAWFNGVSLTDTTGGADVTDSQPIVYTGSSESIVPNGNFTLGTLQGWFNSGFSLGADGFGTRIYAPPSSGSSCFSQSFQVVPGQKYRFVYNVYSSTGPSSTGIFLRVAASPTKLDNVADMGTGNIVDFLANGGVTTTPTEYAFDWVCPAIFYWASMNIFAVGTSDLACRYVGCYPYVASKEWGSDVTGDNTSNDTNNVDNVPSTTIAQVVPTGFKLFINNGARSYSLQAV